MIPRAHISGLILAGGRGSRMGGLDKGLQRFQGIPLAQHAMNRLAPQVNAVAISANRHLDIYATFGATVLTDDLPDFAGPLAGFATGLAHCDTPYLMIVPCDAPLFPTDLVTRLAQALCNANAEMALPLTMSGSQSRLQPVFCLLHRSLAESLETFVRSGGRKVDRWTATRACTLVPFDDAEEFANINTGEELQQLERE